MMRLQLIVLINLFLFLGVFCDQNGDEKRILKHFENPGCFDCTKTELVHIQADSDVDRMHYIFDFTSKPSVLIAKGKKDSYLKINWEVFKNTSSMDSVKIEPQPVYSFAYVLDTIAIFNDTKGTSNYSDPFNTEVIKINPHNLNWTKVILETSENSDNVTLEMNAKYDNGSFSLKYTAFGSPAHGVNLPHLFHTAQAMQIDFVADNVNYTNYKSPRIAIELLLVSDEEKSEGDYIINRIRNLDDEYTPGIFDVYNVVSPRSDATNGSFLQYRPVCYNSKYRSVSSSTESRHGNPINFSPNKLDLTLPYAYFGKSLSTKLQQALNITFSIEDDFYSRTNYISFSYLMGIGFPPVEGLSPFVITFAAITLSIPLLVLVFGGTYVAVKRYRS